ncbi:MAG: RNA-binding S4 domain-containing protein [bacterium]
MRLDLFLKTSKLIKQRSLAKKACRAGLVEVDGEKAKPARAVREGHTICIHSPTRLLEVRVIRVPEGNVSKSDAPSLYEIVRDERKRWEN